MNIQRHRWGFLALTLAAFMLGGCAVKPFGSEQLERDAISYHPGVSPKPNWSAIDPTMACLGDRLRQSRIQPVAFGFSAEDTSGKTGVSINLLGLSALNRVAAKAGNLTVALVANVPRPSPAYPGWVDGAILTREERWKAVLKPKWIIIGGVSSSQSAYRLEQNSVGISVRDGDIGASQTRYADIVNLSFALVRYGDMSSRGAQIDLRVNYQTMRRGVDGGLYVAGSLNGKSRSMGLRLGREVSISQNPEDAVRTGIDYAVTVLLAEHFGVDLTTCPALQQGSGDEVAEDGRIQFEKLPSLYQRMGKPQRVRWVQASLAAIGYQGGEAGGRYRDKTKTMILRYERDTGMPRDGRVTQRLFLHLAAARLARGEDVRVLPAPADKVPAVAITLSSPNAPYRLGHALRAQVLPPLAGHLQCYLQGPKAIIRIYPVRRDQQGFVTARAPTHVPDPNRTGAHPEARLTAVGLHKMWCALTSRDVRDALPRQLRVGTNPIPPDSLEQVKASVRKAAGRLWITEGGTWFRVKEAQKKATRKTRKTTK